MPPRNFAFSLRLGSFQQNIEVRADLSALLPKEVDEAEIVHQKTITK